MTQQSTCTFTVQSVVCGNILGEAADPLAVIMNSNSVIYFTLDHSSNNAPLIICNTGASPPQITHVEVLYNRSVHTFFNTVRAHRINNCLN